MASFCFLIEIYFCFVGFGIAEEDKKDSGWGNDGMIIMTDTITNIQLCIIGSLLLLAHNKDVPLFLTR
ncbi:hypothetical protein F5Y04DRAFT_260509 [Hypomontagnella monticulosa]|nr:hypothetical protein F5Y04DRAFT_260509 [Hypomontagnella monticulosa]